MRNGHIVLGKYFPKFPHRFLIRSCWPRSVYLPTSLLQEKLFSDIPNFCHKQGMFTRKGEEDGCQRGSQQPHHCMCIYLYSVNQGRFNYPQQLKPPGAHLGRHLDQIVGGRPSGYSRHPGTQAAALLAMVAGVRKHETLCTESKSLSDASDILTLTVPWKSHLAARTVVIYHFSVGCPMPILNFCHYGRRGNGYWGTINHI